MPLPQLQPIVKKRCVQLRSQLFTFPGKAMPGPVGVALGIAASSMYACTTSSYCCTSGRACVARARLNRTCRQGVAGLDGTPAPLNLDRLRVHARCFHQEWLSLGWHPYMY